MLDDNCQWWARQVGNDVESLKFQIQFVCKFVCICNFNLYVNIATHIGIIAISIIDVCLRIHEIFVCNGFFAMWIGVHSSNIGFHRIHDKYWFSIDFFHICIGVLTS